MEGVRAILRQRARQFPFACFMQRSADLTDERSMRNTGRAAAVFLMRRTAELERTCALEFAMPWRTKTKLSIGCP